MGGEANFHDSPPARDSREEVRNVRAGRFSGRGAAPGLGRPNGRSRRPRGVQRVPGARPTRLAARGLPSPPRPLARLLSRGTGHASAQTPPAPRGTARTARQRRAGSARAGRKRGGRVLTYRLRPRRGSPPPAGQKRRPPGRKHPCGSGALPSPLWEAGGLTRWYPRPPPPVWPAGGGALGGGLFV